MITAITSLKGGVGKTTSAVNLAAALAERGQRVLLVDLDPNGAASMSLGQRPGSRPHGIVDVLQRGLPMAEAIFGTGVPDLDLVTASVDLRSADIELDQLRRRDLVLHQALESLEGRYDHVVLDCAPHLNVVMRNALVASDGYLIPAMPHFLAIEGIDQLVSSAGRIAWRSGRRCRFHGVVLNGVDYRIRSTRDRVREIRDRFGKKVFAVEIRTNVSLADAPAHGQTVFQYRPNSTGARAYRLLCDEFLALAEPAVSAPEPAVLVGT